MKKKLQEKETRGRKPKIHKPVPASFDEVLGAISKSSYKDEEKLKDKKSK